jgi:hypothetical protein
MQTTPIEIKQDGVVLGKAQWDVAVPADPGGHVIAAQAPDKEAWSVRVVARAGATLEVLVPELKDPTHDLPARDPTASASAARGPGSLPAPQDESPRDNWRKPAYIAGGAFFVLGSAVGTFAGITALSKKSQSGDGCTQGCNDTREQARTYGDVATVALGLAAAGLVFDTVLWLSAPKSGSSAWRVEPEWARGPGTLPVGVRATWSRSF